VIGDALGAPFEFTHYISHPVKGAGHAFMERGFEDDNLWYTTWGNNTFRLRVGQWTDDASMGLCLADSLIACQGFNSIDLRLRFHMWWNYGYCNAFGKDPKRHDKGSVGLGGNISLSLREFEHHLDKGEIPQETRMGDKATSGNGSIMRNGALPLYYRNNLGKALEFAAKQSKTTHQGIEAYECCRLLTFIVIKSIKSPNATARQILNNLISTESSTLFFSVDPNTPTAERQNVEALARGENRIKKILPRSSR